METFVSEDPKEIEEEKKRQAAYRKYLPDIMGDDEDETEYILLPQKKNAEANTAEKPHDKRAGYVQNLVNKAKVLAKEASFALDAPVTAWKIGPGVIHNSTNISTKATRFATKGPILHGAGPNEKDPGTENGAFRHTLWQAEIASRFGELAAKRAGNAHEVEPNINLNNRRFNYIENADQTTDLLNNQIGRRIGVLNPDRSTKDLAFMVLDEFRNNGLYITEQDEQGFFNVKKIKLSSEKYDSLRNIYNTLNKDGFTQKELFDIEEKINKDGRTFKGIDTPWRTIR